MTVVDGRKDMLGFLDREIVDEFAHHLRDRGVKLRLAETVESVEVIDDKKLIVHLASGKRVRANMALFASGRQSNTDQLNLEKAGLTRTNVAASQWTDSSARRSITSMLPET